MSPVAQSSPLRRGRSALRSRMRRAARPRCMRRSAAAKDPCACQQPPSDGAQKSRRSSSTSPQRGLHDARRSRLFEPASSWRLGGRGPKLDFSCLLRAGYSANRRKLYAGVSTTGWGTAMNYLAFGSAALAAMMAAPAIAADMPVRAPAPVVAYYDWSGAYAGFNVGGAWYDVTHHFTTPGAVTPDVTTSDSDGIFGFHAGAQW